MNEALNDLDLFLWYK